MATQGISTQATEGNTPSPLFDREAIHAKLMFLSSAVGLMDGEHRTGFDDNAEFALSIFLSEIAKQVWPDWDQGDRP